jgi:aspartyl-tRNA(Asn)/glutamyl-tRNA(Gln) amidotransferase subunit C
MAAPPVVDRALLQRLAELARLHVPAERQTKVLQSMQRVVEAFDALRELDTPPVDPAAAASSLRLREDAATAPLPLDEVLANAPQTAAGMFVVPRVVDG